CLACGRPVVKSARLTAMKMSSGSPTWRRQRIPSYTQRCYSRSGSLHRVGRLSAEYPYPASMANRDVQVLIVGGGPTGLTLACDLARRGVPFRIVDKASSYFIGSKGKGLQPRILEVLDDLGIVGQVLANGKFHVPMRGYDGAKVLGERDMHEG